MAAGERGAETSGRARLLLLVAAVALLLGVAGAGAFFLKAKRQPVRKVVLVTIDALRADRLGCYGYKLRETSPNLDRFASQAALFEKAMVQAPWTGPSMASVMTGHYPREIGMYRNRDGIKKEFPLLAEHFQRAGFRTASFMTNSLLLGQANGFLRGFDDTSEPQRTKIPYTDLEPHVFDWLERHARDSFFVWIHDMDPHPPR
jgi:arylsulfatase A-like enzyme